MRLSVHVIEYRRRAEELLKRAIRETDLRARGVLLEEAMIWHHMAVEEHANRQSRLGEGNGHTNSTN
jgi:hypothetical protein